MKTKIIIFVFAITFILLSVAFGQESISFDDAKGLSKEQGKPILMEFVRED